MPNNLSIPNSTFRTYIVSVAKKLFFFEYRTLVIFLLTAMLQFISSGKPKGIKIKSWKYNPLAKYDEDEVNDCEQQQLVEK